MKQIGFTDVFLVWGFDGAAFASRVTDSKEAIAAAHKVGLGAYLFVWHGRYSSLPHDPRDEQVDAAGHKLFAFDTFNPHWRQTQWKSYLQTLALAYRQEPGMAGYVFDNSFAIGYIGAVDGPEAQPDERFISYGEAEREAMGRPLPHAPDAPGWSQWTALRQQAWADWARDTRNWLRAIDTNPGHRIILEDGENTLDPDIEARVGLKLGKVIPYFDTMSAYWAPHYSDPKGSRLLAEDLTSYLKAMRAEIGPDKDLSLSLRLTDDGTEATPGHADTPTAAQIKTAIDAALSMGIRRIDLYGYRMGVFHLDNPGWSRYLPGTGPTYPLTGQVEGKFLADRPELWPELKKYLEQISAASTPVN